MPGNHNDVLQWLIQISKATQISLSQMNPHPPHDPSGVEAVPRQSD
jgi:hypothetical protein